MLHPQPPPFSTISHLRYASATFNILCRTTTLNLSTAAAVAAIDNVTLGSFTFVRTTASRRFPGTSSPPASESPFHNLQWVTEALFIVPLICLGLASNTLAFSALCSRGCRGRRQQWHTHRAITTLLQVGLVRDFPLRTRTSGRHKERVCCERRQTISAATLRVMDSLHHHGCYWSSIRPRQKTEHGCFFFQPRTAQTAAAHSLMYEFDVK